jgi:ubiquinone/menaquinone biosynthesis C-methylase UbiE
LEDGSVDAAFVNMVLHHREYPAAMLREMVRVVRPGGTVAITAEVEHPYAWMRDEHADVWPEFGSAQVEHFFGEAGLEGYGYESLGIHHCIPSTTSGEIADIGIFAAGGTVPR